MELLCELDNVRVAQAFVDYLRTIGIEGQLTAGTSNSVAIFVPSNDMQRARNEYAAFCENPNDEKYLAASWQTGTTKPLFKYQTQSLNLVPRFLKLSPLIQLVAVISVAIYGGFLLGYFDNLYALLSFKAAQPVSWFTPTVMHFSAIHLVFNLMWWLYLGERVVAQLGHKTLLIVFVMTALCSSWLQYIMVSENFGGLSGVVYGLLGFCWIYGYLRPTSGLGIGQGVVGFMLVWMVLGFADVLFVSMANWAHLAGLLSGMICAYSTSLIKKS